MQYQFDDSWKEWIHHNLNQGCDKDGIVKILLENDFHPQAIMNEMNYIPISKNVLGVFSLKIKEESLHPIVFQKSFQDMHFSSKNNTLSISTNDTKALDSTHLAFAKKIKSDKVHMYTIDDFLTHDECDGVIQRINKECRPSTITNPNEVDKEFRTSQTCDLSQNPDKFTKDLDRRIAEYIGYEVERSEGIQGQFYKVGNQFKTHTDYFEPGSKEFELFAKDLGQRTWTFMIYLNDVKKGGQTEFTELGLDFSPKKGQAVVWNSIKADGKVNNNTSHWAKPIIKGKKYIITKWFRTHGSLKTSFVPFLHNQVPTFTKQGFKKTKLPKNLYKKILDFYQEKRHDALDEDDAALGTFIHTKEKTTASKMIELSDALRKEIFEATSPMLEKWSGQSLEYTSVYGIREYQHGASLDMHVDRYETHIISMIINVDQDVNTNWPLYVYDHFCRIHKVILRPGEIIFYESAKIAHGRPKPLDGKRYANIFVHTMPKDWESKATRMSEQLSSGEIQEKLKFTDNQ